MFGWSAARSITHERRERVVLVASKNATASSAVVAGVTGELWLLLLVAVAVITVEDDQQQTRDANRHYSPAILPDEE